MNKKKTIIVIAISAILMLQLVPLTGAKPDYKGYMDTDYGTHEALVNLLDEKDQKTSNLDIEPQDLLNKSRKNAEELELDEDFVEELDNEIADAWNEVEVNTELEKVVINNISKIEHLKPHIFDVVEGNETISSLLDTIIDIIWDSGFYKIHIKYTDDGGTYERTLEIGLLDSLLAVINPLFNETESYQTIDIEPDAQGEYNDNRIGTDWDIRARIVPEIGPDSAKFVYGDNEVDILDVNIGHLTGLISYLANVGNDDFEWPYIIFTGGVRFDIQERNRTHNWWPNPRIDKEIPGTLEVAILRGIGYTNSRYVWLLQSSFPKGCVPDDFSFYITIQAIKIDLIAGGIEDITNMATYIIGIIMSGLTTSNEANITSLNPPYRIGYRLQDNLNIPQSSLNGLTLLGGYVKVKENSDESYEVVDRVWIEAKISPGQDEDEIPYKGILTISTKEEEGAPAGETVYDSVQWDAPCISQLNVTYTEEEENRTYIFANFTDMPTYFKIKLDNKSTDEEILSELYYETETEIEFASYESFIYKRDKEKKNLWFCNETHVSLYNIPTNFTLTGTFVLESEKDRFTFYDNPDQGFIEKYIDNIMLRLASKIYAVGMTLRGIPSSIMDIPGKGGWFHLKFQDNRSYFPDYVGMIEFWHSSNRYLWIEDKNMDFFSLYNQTKWAEDSPRTIDKVIDMPLSGRISGIGELYYESYNKNTTVEISTGLHNSNKKFEKKFRFFYREPHDYDYSTESYKKEEDIYDFAEVAISDIPDKIKVKITEEEVKYYSTESIDVTYTSLIRRDRYYETHKWDYMRFNIGKVPTFLSFHHKDGVFTIDTEPTGEDKEILNNLDPDDKHRYFNFDFIITNDVDIDSHTGNYYPLEGNYMSLYQDNIDIPGKDEINMMSGNFTKLKYIHYENETVDGMVYFVIDKEKNDDKLKIAVKNDTIREGYDAIDRLDAYAIIKPMPSHIEVKAEKSKKEEIETPEITNVSSIADIVKLIHAVEDMGVSIVDMISNLTTGVIDGLGEFQSNLSFEYELKENLDVTISLKKGDMDLLDEDTRWIQGICARQKTVKVSGEDEIILDTKFHLEGLPTKGKIKMNTTEEWTYAKINLDNYQPHEYLLVDVKGLKERDILVYFDLSDINNPIDIEANVDMMSNDTENRINGTFGFNITSHEGGHDVNLGSIYINMKDYSNNPYSAEAYLPSIPATFSANFDTGDNLTIKYDSNTPIDYIIANVGMGDENEVKKIEKDTEWTHGVSAAQNKLDNDTITSAKIFLTGLPSAVEINLNKTEEYAKISAEFDNWEPKYDWFLLEAKGIDNKNDILIYQNNLRPPLDLSINVYVEIDTSGPKDKLNCTLDLNTNKDLGQTYIKVRNYENRDEPMIIEGLLPKIPSSFSADISVTESIKIETEGKGEVEYVWLKIEKRVDNEWHDLTIILHNLPEKFFASVEPNTKPDFEKPLFLQGYPNIEIRTYDAMHFIDLNLDMDGRVQGNRGFTKLHAEHVGDKTTLFLNGDIYSIRSPQKIDFVLYKMGDLPVQKEYYLESIEIYSEELKSVDVSAHMLFGCYPMFKLEKCDAKMLHLAFHHKLKILGKTMDLKAAIIDFKIKESGAMPMLSPITVNGVTTKMDSKHYILPEPVTTLFVTLLS